MSSVMDEMKAVLEESEEDLEHYGMPRRSGRYPWGSGDDPYQRNRDFLGRIEELKKTGWTETPENIMKEFGISTTRYRTQRSIAKDERRMLNVAKAESLRKDGMTDSQIGREMGVNESTVRSWFNAKSSSRMNQAKETAEFIKNQIAEKGTVDVGVGVERELNISKERLKQAIAILENEGYMLQSGRVEQVTNKGQWTTVKALMPPGSDPKDFYAFTKGEANIASLNDYISKDDGKTFEKKYTYPESMDPKRLKVIYADQPGIDGKHLGVEKDGLVELRRGVEDLSLGEKRYSQVRILVDGTHYIKGMAVYSDNMPDGIDVVFNTNKQSGTPILGPKNNSVLKTIKKDPDNPFGSAIKDADQGGQYWYEGKDGKKHLGLINKRADEGDWTEWKDALPSQFLSKQSLQMAKKQLNLAATDRIEEFDEICALTNPTVKKYLLNKFADSCDSAAVDLKAAALPGQKYHVIIPVPSMKDTEVYAPRYDDGTQVALIRYPHGGTFEIPILKVNNKQPDAKKVLGDVIDAVGINSKVAERLSGADFDGDTVMVIPTNDRAGKVKITSTKPLDKLVGFDPKLEYGCDKSTIDSDGTEHYFRNGREFKPMKNTGTQMGIISNLITDMTLRGADFETEIADAVRHSMVVIDAEKHHLDYKQSEVDHNISALKKKYQTSVDEDGKTHVGGASTLISRSKGETSVVKRQGSPIIDPETGKVSYKIADDAYYDIKKVNKKTGEVTTVTKTRMQRSTKMAEATDATKLISEAKTPMETAYAKYANQMKSLANQARKEMMATGKIEYSRSANTAYKTEVQSLNSKLNTALLNSPRERQAQIKATAEVNRKKAANPEMKPDDIKKASQQALTKYRTEVGSVSRSDRSIKISDREWEAIQAGAVSENVLKKILDNTDVDNLRQKATPRATTTLSQAKVNRIKAMSESNYSSKEIAKALGISMSAVYECLKKE